MIKIVFSTITLFLNFITPFAQDDLKGLYTASLDEKVYYINFTNNSFRLFSLKNSPTPDNLSNTVLDKIGLGKFMKKGSSLLLIFDSLNKTNQIYSADSINVSFHTKKDERNSVYFNVDIKYLIPEYKNNALVINSYSKEYFYPINENQLNVTFPDSIRIKSVKLRIMGYDERTLPYDDRFNSFSYIYYFREKGEYIDYIYATKWDIPISLKGTKSIKLKTAYLNKLDSQSENFLKAASKLNPPIASAISGWFN